MKLRKHWSLVALAFAIALPASAATDAYWRFEAGPANTDVLHGTPDGVFDGTVQDVSGNGNNLSAWTQGSWAGYGYRSDVPVAVIPGTGAPDTLSVKNTGGYPGMFTNSAASAPSGIDVETMTPSQFTVEVSYKPEANGNYRTVVGRDARNVATSNGDLAALYLQVRPNDAVAISFTDMAGNFHEAVSAPGLIQGFTFSTDPDGLLASWYNLVGVSDGSTLSLYLNNQLVASTDISGSADTRLAVGTTSGSDWHAGGWSVGRGLYAGGHTDRAYGFIDEVRISDTALTPDQFLMVPEPGSMSVLLLGLAGMGLRRRRPR